MSGSGDTPYSQLSICHAFNTSSIRATIWDTLISPASAILLQLKPCWSTVCVEKQLQSQQGKCRYQSWSLDKCMLLSCSRSTSVQNSVLFVTPVSLNLKGRLAHTSLYVGVSKDKPDTQLLWLFRVNSDLTHEEAPSLRTGCQQQVYPCFSSFIKTRIQTYRVQQPSMPCVQKMVV